MLKIGHIELDMPAVQAALSGYSNAAMRLLARKFGAPFAFHEVVLDKFVTHKGKHQKKLLTIPENDHPVGGQLMGAEPEQFAQSAALMAQAGYDIIDINFGCPVRKVLGRCRGGYLLSTPDTAVEIIKAVRNAVPPKIPVTLKMRRGMDDSIASAKNFWKIFDAAWENDLAAITVHPRTVEQKYKGCSNWDFLTEVKKKAGNQTILGSGDLFNAQDCMDMLEQTGVDGLTIARGCIGNPWIFREVRALLNGEPLPAPPSVAEQGEIIREHYLLTEQFYDPKPTGKIMLRFGARYGELHPFPKDVRLAFVTARTRDEWMAVVDKWYDPNKDWPPPRPRKGRERLICAGASE